MSPRHLEFDLYLSDALADEDPRPTDEQLDTYASSYLVPMEYDAVGSSPCPGCGEHKLRVRMQRTRDIREHPRPEDWPYHCPAGDTLLVICTGCNAETNLVFWFRK